MGLFDGIGSNFAEEVVPKILADMGVLPVHELVRRVHEGDASKWHDAATKADAIVTAHHEASERSRKMLQVLESSWTGAGADAAANKIRLGAQATQTSAEVYASNARVYTDGAHTFDSIKQQLPPVSANPPERGVVDVLTPWDTDTEDQINQHKADVERARQIYQGYEQAMQSAQQGVVKDFGSLGTFDGDLGTIERDKSGTVKDAGTGVRTFDEPTSTSRSAAPSSSQPVTTGGPTSTQGYSTPHLPSSPQPDSRTSASGFVPSDVSRPAAAAPNYTTPSFNPPNTGFGPGGGNSSYHPPGFGPVGGPGGFGPAGGGSAGGGSAGGGGRFSVPRVGAGANGMPGGGAAAGGAVGSAGGAVGVGAPGSGRATGTAPFGPAGGGPAAAGGAAGAAGGRGAMPMGAMGGAAGRGGQGGGDEEHQRQYVQATDEAFALTENGEVLRDPVTGNLVAPPTIGG